MRRPCKNTRQHNACERRVALGQLIVMMKLMICHNLHNGKTPELREDLISLGTRLETDARTASHAGPKHQAICQDLSYEGMYRRYQRRFYAKGKRYLRGDRPFCLPLLTVSAVSREDLTSPHARHTIGH